jgi:release factor glutamine methyltransferase
MMSAERAERLRVWHEQAYAGGQRDAPLTTEHLGFAVVVQPEVYPPNPLGLAEVVLQEVRDGDRVLDIGTGSGINALAAGTRANEVLAVDINPTAVACARDNAQRNGLSERIDVRESDLFTNVSGRFDLILFDPPFRWFRPRDMRERSMADENYETLTAFFEQLPAYLAPSGRVLLSFGTTGDIDYLRRLMNDSHMRVEELRKVEFEKDDLPVAYFVFRLSGGKAPVSGQCWLDPLIAVRPSRIEGLGLFAATPIRRGAVVGILGGRAIDDEELGHIARTREKYNSAAIDEGVNLLLEDDELIARGNHSCDPNLWMRDAFTLEARRDIALGEEVTVDYGLQTAVEWEMPCNCGSPLCRGVIRGTDWQIPELQQRYAGHFSPFLNERIAALPGHRGE